MNNILVTGGAGYIGSIAVEELLKKGFNPIVLDNLSEGHRAALPSGIPFYKGKVGDAKLLTRVFTENSIDLVMHFAALALVGDSVAHPEHYFENNVTQTKTLLASMLEHNINKFIFSSSCATFGEPIEIPITEKHPQKPMNPYGETKLIIERKLKELHTTHGLKSCSLRYFNAAGATEINGEDRKKETHLIPLVLDVALGKKDHINIYGTDYATADGTCIRDYIHVLDLVDAHIKAIDYLNRIPLSFFNLGNGQGFSVKEIIEHTRTITRHAIPAQVTARRPGDPAQLIGSAAQAKQELHWTPKHSDIDIIIKTAWHWRQKHPQGYKA